MQLVGLSLIRGNRGVTLVVVSLTPLAWPIVALLAGGDAVKGSFGFLKLLTLLYFPRVNLFVALFLGCAALGEEIDGRTLPYLLVRPIPRAALLLGRWLAGTVNAGALLTGAFVVTYGVTVGQMGVQALVVDLPVLGWSLVALWIGVAAYCAFFVLLTIVVKWPLMIGIALLFLWEEWAASMPGSMAHYTLLHHLYSLLAHWTGEPTYQSLASPHGDRLLTTQQSLQVIVGFAAVSLALALARFRKRPYLV